MLAELTDGRKQSEQGDDGELGMLAASLLMALYPVQ